MIRFIFSCDECGKIFSKKDKTPTINNFCSKGCQNKWRKDRGKKGKEVKCNICGETFSNRSSRKEMSMYCSRKCAGEAHSRGMSGSLHHNWKGGVSKRDITKSQEWREQVFIRDNYTCQKCGDTNTYLNAHHILGWARYEAARFKVSNGITLCKSCHMDFHNTYTRTRFTEDDLVEYLDENNLQ